jgi:hypothetical protein
MISLEKCPLAGLWVLLAGATAVSRRRVACPDSWICNCCCCCCWSCRCWSCLFINLLPSPFWVQPGCPSVACFEQSQLTWHMQQGVRSSMFGVVVRGHIVHFRRSCHRRFVLPLSEGWQCLANIIGTPMTIGALISAGAGRPSGNHPPCWMHITGTADQITAAVVWCFCACLVNRSAAFADIP